MSGASTALHHLVSMGLASGTATGYAGHFAAFEEYCEREGVSALPAARTTILAYVGYIAQRGTVAAGSLQPTLSAINRAHRDVGLEAQTHRR